MADIPVFTLNDGTKIPSVGMGCWMGSPGGGEKVEIMCKKAIEHGYRHFDTASGYGNEQHVGKAIKESGIPRSEFYVTTKLPNTDHHDVQHAFEESFKNLDCDYIDLYLMHFPQAVIVDANTKPEDAWLSEPLPPDASPTFVETWQAMEQLLGTGKLRSIGVSNFSIKLLDQLLPRATVVPVVNQVELHPCLPSNELIAYCRSKDILPVAYSPLGQTQPVFFTEPTVTAIAQTHAATPAQVVLSWGVQRGTPVIPKSENEDRMKANITLLTLSPEEMARIDAIHKKPGMHKALTTIHVPGSNKTFGWTYEQLGWNFIEGGIVPESE
ncbi:aado/keto reductase [Punctularia strigosozonata HHB-11173 SS5]|uniref:Aado/keto reductase n=1 Tax=Punctularia strigosozonata (strain HHB-11173) TaxID=741275 RepID=R7S0K6_PUNST|nr:aldo/keto reductase [Punctularia strigosozonata HHB-11173 SS5]EIN03930.1 aado/keto reductase [Punctularia strigosozonata HHB-11173 SS5]